MTGSAKVSLVCKGSIAVGLHAKTIAAWEKCDAAVTTEAVVAEACTTTSYAAQVLLWSLWSILFGPGKRRCQGKRCL